MQALNKMTGLIVVLLLTAGLHLISAQTGMGPYYVRNHGFHPGTFLDEDSPIKYKTGLTAAPDYLITGNYWVSRRVGPLGLIITADKKAQGGMGIVNSGQKLSFPDICNMQGFTLDAFRERFTGVIDKDCCLDPGNYTLNNWSIEFHMKEIKEMLWGEYFFHLCWTEGGKKDCMLNNHIKILFDDIKNKKAQEKSGKNKGKSKGSSKKKDKGKSPFPGAGEFP